MRGGVSFDNVVKYLIKINLRKYQFDINSWYVTHTSINKNIIFNKIDTPPSKLHFHFISFSHMNSIITYHNTITIYDNVINI